MIWNQTFIELAPLPRGFHLVTNEVLAQAPDLANCEVGLLHLFIQHTSASLAINENADPDVRGDLERHFNVMVPETRRTTNTPRKGRTTCRPTSRVS